MPNHCTYLVSTSEKYQSVGIIIPNIWKKAKCSKPPASDYHILLNIQIQKRWMLLKLSVGKPHWIIQDWTKRRWLVATKMGDAWPTTVIMVWFWTCHPKKLENYFIAVSVGLHLTSPKCDCTSLEAPTSYPLHQSWLAKGTPKSSKWLSGWWF